MCFLDCCSSISAVHVSHWYDRCGCAFPLSHPLLFRAGQGNSDSFSFLLISAHVLSSLLHPITVPSSLQSVSEFFVDCSIVAVSSLLAFVPLSLAHPKKKRAIDKRRQNEQRTDQKKRKIKLCLCFFFLT